MISKNVLLNFVLWLTIVFWYYGNMVNKKTKVLSHLLRLYCKIVKGKEYYNGKKNG